MIFSNLKILKEPLYSNRGQDSNKKALSLDFVSTLFTSFWSFLKYFSSNSSRIPTGGHYAQWIHSDSSPPQRHKIHVLGGWLWCLHSHSQEERSCHWKRLDFCSKFGKKKFSFSFLSVSNKPIFPTQIIKTICNIYTKKYSPPLSVMVKWSLECHFLQSAIPLFSSSLNSFCEYQIHFLPWVVNFLLIIFSLLVQIYSLKTVRYLTRNRKLLDHWREKKNYHFFTQKFFIP